jgi:UrcA family protein
MNNISKYVATIGLLAAAFAAVAAGPTIVTTSKVHYGDLNLESQEGVAQLYSRLNHAARSVCINPGSSFGLAQKGAERQCVRDAIANAVSKVNKPQLTAYYRAKAGIKEEQVFSKL